MLRKRDKCFSPIFLYMNKIIYIIPALGESCVESPYVMLTNALEKKGYTVKQVNPNWYRPLSEQVFKVEEEAVVFGFSFGAVIAYLNAIKYPCRKVIFGSLSPIDTFSYESLVEDYMEYMPKDLAEEISADIKNIKIDLTTLKVPFVTLAGDKENMQADISVPHTGHHITGPYIECIVKLV